MTKDATSPSIRQMPLSTLRGKILLLASLLPLITVLGFALFTYTQMTRLTMRMALDSFASETRLMATRFASAYQDIRYDAMIALRTPPVLGIARAEKSGTDPRDPSTTEQWRKRLEMIFSSIMTSNPHYIRMEYIGVALQGRVLVATQRLGETVLPVSQPQHINRQEAPFYKQALKLKKDDTLIFESTGEATVSPSSSSVQPVVFAIVPVYLNGDLFGLIAIESDYQIMMRQVLLEFQPNREVYIVNSFGDYMVWARDGNFSGLVFHNRGDGVPNDFAQLLLNNTDTERTIIGKQTVSYAMRLPLNADNFSHLNIAMRIPKNELLHEVEQTQNKIILLTLSVAFFVLIVAGWTSRRLMRPLKEMTANLLSSEPGLWRRMPTDRRDEIGDLARAFESMRGNLHNEEARMQIIFENTFDGILAFDTNGSIRLANPACARIFGYDRPSLLNKDIRALLDHESLDIVFSYIRKREARQNSPAAVLSREIRGQRNDGSLFAMDLSLRDVQIDGAPLFIGVLRDVSERKKAENLKDRFASTITHEMHTPLVTLQETLGALRGASTVSADEKCRKLIDTADHQCRHMAGLLADVLDIERIAAGKMDYQVEEVNICPLVQYAVEQHQLLAEEENIKIEIQNLCQNARCKIDSVRFLQALDQLLSNAVKFSPAGASVYVDVALRDEAMVQISVVDQGCGIPLTFQDRIFEKFTQADNAPLRGRGGSGLGLSIAKSIIQAFDGVISFDSEEGKGSTFRITLPLCKPQVSGPPREAA